MRENWVTLFSANYLLELAEGERQANVVDCAKSNVQSLHAEIGAAHSVSEIEKGDDGEIFPACAAKRC